MDNINSNLLSQTTEVTAIASSFELGQAIRSNTDQIVAKLLLQDGQFAELKQKEVLKKTNQDQNKTIQDLRKDMDALEEEVLRSSSKLKGSKQKV